MSVKSDRWIRRMAEQHGMIEPFEPNQIKQVNGRPVVSFGTSSYGYDVRCSDDFKLFTDINSTIVDPKNFDPKSFVDVKGEYCIIPPNSFALARTVEYFRIPRNVLVLCLGKSTYARCFRGDTRVALVDGTAPTLEEMARRAEGGELFWGYSIGPAGRLIVTLLDAPRYIGRDALLEVVLDNGLEIRATPDHEFLRRDGTHGCGRHAAAGRLADAAVPQSQTRLRDGLPAASTAICYPTHRLADEWNLRHGIYADEPGTHRHHIDHDRRNNRAGSISSASQRRITSACTTRNLRCGLRRHRAWRGDPVGHRAAGQDPAWASPFLEGASRSRARPFGR